MADFVQHPVVQALAWALVHFVWQGAAIGLAAVVAFRVVRSSPSLRYGIGVGALTLMLAAPVATFVTLVNDPVSPVSAASGATAELGRAAPVELPATAMTGLNRAEAERGAGAMPRVLAMAVLGWIAGVVFFSVRLFGGWVVARRLAQRAVQPASEGIQAIARQLSDRLALGKAVAILQSSAVAVPVVVGWLKPAVVLPMAALSGLSPTQVEALLAHELAHVRRHDYLVNLLQSVAEALLFYHPAVWWLSRRVRAERELCCDDLAVGMCDRLVYATALTDLAAMASPRVALAATDGDLLGRVRRILGRGDGMPTVRGGLMPALALALVAGIAVPAALASAKQAPAAAPGIALASIPDGLGAWQTPPQTPPPTTSPTPQQTAQQQVERQRQIEEARRKLEEARKELAELDAQRAGEIRASAEEIRAKAVEMSQKALEQAQVARQAELQAARKQVEDATKRFEMGLISESQLQEAKAALARVEAKGDATAMIAAELQAVRAMLDRSNRLVDRGLMASTDTVAMEAALKALDARMADLQLRLKQEVTPAAIQGALQSARERLTAADLQQREALLAARLSAVGRDEQMVDLQALRAQIDKMVQGRLEVTPEPVANAAEPVKAGDVLRITISGEPDLPTTYRVTGDGTIRLPFLGAIKVVGLTAAQVREAVGKQLSAKKLGSIAQVQVMVTRASRPK